MRVNVPNRLVPAETVFWHIDNEEFQAQNLFFEGCGCATVGIAVTSETRGPGSNPVTCNFTKHLFSVNCKDKTRGD